jgi:hypothetical protein
MQLDPSKMELTEAQATELREPVALVSEEFLDPAKKPANVVGVAAGVKWTGGEPTGKPALLVLVDQKLPEDALRKSDLIPKRLQNRPTDVLAVGQPFAGQFAVPGDGVTEIAPKPAEEALARADLLTRPDLLVKERDAFEQRYEQLEVGAQVLARRMRPAEGGYSVGHVTVTAGTIATCVYDVGAAVPARFYILSNNHVLAHSNAAVAGDPILQPGRVDGGTDPADRIARLSRFIPITFDPPTPRAQHRNLVDAAVAEGQFHDLDREIYWIGYVRGWRQRVNVRVGTPVHKTGRTTNYTQGRITAVNATIDVNYGSGMVARFLDQIVTTPMSAGGDSGSLVTTLDNVALGLLFAGSPQATILNQLEHVRSLLRVEVAQQIL